MAQVYDQLVIRSMEIEKQIAFDNNNLASFRKKWAVFKQCPLEKYFDPYSSLKSKWQAGRWRIEGQKAGSLLLIVNKLLK